MAPQSDQGKVTIAATCDGGLLAWNLSHVSAGIKLADPNTVDPRTGDHQMGLQIAAPADMCSLVRTVGRGHFIQFLHKFYRPLFCFVFLL
jgi:hypothetical protein